MYLGPWTYGLSFGKNVLPSITIWIKLVDVAHSYWSYNCLGSISRFVGRPLSLDKQTSMLNPLKYDGMLVELKYGAPYPKVIMVLVIREEDNTIVQSNVCFVYLQFHFHVIFCKTFGQCVSRCAYNPNISKEKPDVARASHTKDSKFRF